MKMAFELNDLKGILFLVLFTIPLTSSTNINCDGKPFHCLNSTHFMICVDLGGGLTTTIDDFVIPCPPTTTCHRTNHFECEFPTYEEPAPPLEVIGVSEVKDNSVVSPTVSSVTTVMPIVVTTEAPLPETKTEAVIPIVEANYQVPSLEILEHLKEEFTGGNDKVFDVPAVSPNSTHGSNASDVITVNVNDNTTRAADTHINTKAVKEKNSTDITVDVAVIDNANVATKIFEGVVDIKDDRNSSHHLNISNISVTFDGINAPTQVVETNKTLTDNVVLSTTTLPLNMISVTEAKDKSVVSPSVSTAAAPLDITTAVPLLETNTVIPTLEANYQVPRLELLEHLKEEYTGGNEKVFEIPVNRSNNIHRLNGSDIITTNVSENTTFITDTHIITKGVKENSTNIAAQVPVLENTNGTSKTSLEAASEMKYDQNKSLNTNTSYKNISETKQGLQQVNKNLVHDAGLSTTTISEGLLASEPKNPQDQALILNNATAIPIQVVENTTLSDSIKIVNLTNDTVVETTAVPYVNTEKSYHLDKPPDNITFINQEIISLDTSSVAPNTEINNNMNENITGEVNNNEIKSVQENVIKVIESVTTDIITTMVPDIEKSIGTENNIVVVTEANVKINNNTKILTTQFPFEENSTTMSVFEPDAANTHVLANLNPSKIYSTITEIPTDLMNTINSSAVIEKQQQIDTTISVDLEVTEPSLFPTESYFQDGIVSTETSQPNINIKDIEVTPSMFPSTSTLDAKEELNPNKTLVYLNRSKSVLNNKETYPDPPIGNMSSNFPSNISLEIRNNQNESTLNITQLDTELKTQSILENNNHYETTTATIQEFTVNDNTMTTVNPINENVMTSPLAMYENHNNLFKPEYPPGETNTEYLILHKPLPFIPHLLRLPHISPTEPTPHITLQTDSTITVDSNKYETNQVQTVKVTDTKIQTSIPVVKENTNTKYEVIEEITTPSPFSLVNNSDKNYVDFATEGKQILIETEPNKVVSITSTTEKNNMNTAGTLGAENVEYYTLPTIETGTDIKMKDIPIRAITENSNIGTDKVEIPITSIVVTTERSPIDVIPKQITTQSRDVATRKTGNGIQVHTEILTSASIEPRDTIINETATWSTSEQIAKAENETKAISSTTEPTKNGNVITGKNTELPLSTNITVKPNRTVISLLPSSDINEEQKLIKTNNLKPMLSTMIVKDTIVSELTNGKTNVSLTNKTDIQNETLNVSNIASTSSVPPEGITATIIKPETESSLKISTTENILQVTDIPKKISDHVLTLPTVSLLDKDSNIVVSKSVSDFSSISSVVTETTNRNTVAVSSDIRLSATNIYVTEEAVTDKIYMAEPTKPSVILDNINYQKGPLFTNTMVEKGVESQTMSTDITFTIPKLVTNEPTSMNFKNIKSQPMTPDVKLIISKVTKDEPASTDFKNMESQSLTPGVKLVTPEVTNNQPASVNFQNTDSQPMIPDVKLIVPKVTNNEPVPVNIKNVESQTISPDITLARPIVINNKPVTLSMQNMESQTISHDIKLTKLKVPKDEPGSLSVRNTESKLISPDIGVAILTVTNNKSASTIFKNAESGTMSTTIAIPKLTNTQPVPTSLQNGEPQTTSPDIAPAIPTWTNKPAPTIFKRIESKTVSPGITLSIPPVTEATSEQKPNIVATLSVTKMITIEKSVNYNPSSSIANNPVTESTSIVESIKANDQVIKARPILGNMTYSEIIGTSAPIDNSSRSILINESAGFKNATDTFVLRNNTIIKSSNIEGSSKPKNREDITLDNTLPITQINVEVSGDESDKEEEKDEEYESASAYNEVPSQIEIISPKPDDSITKETAKALVDSKKVIPEDKQVSSSANASIHIFDNNKYHSNKGDEFGTENVTVNNPNSNLTDQLSDNIHLSSIKSFNNKTTVGKRAVDGMNVITTNQANNRTKVTTDQKNDFIGRLNGSNPDKVNNSAPAYSCANSTRGKYADSKDCRKFYICIGKLQPVVGICPNNTVFSEINKQCTRNLSHCVRNNQFHCLYEGRFSDFLKDNIYYICTKNNKHGFYRYKLQCQNGYYLNKATVRCEQNVEVFSQSASSVSENYMMSERNVSSTKSEESKKSKKPDFECKKEGKFAYPDDRRKYYVCTKNSKDEYRRKIKKCLCDEVFDKKKKKCVSGDSDEC